jgi:hypothetical protein
VSGLEAIYTCHIRYEFSSISVCCCIIQVAMGLFGAKHRPQKEWLQTALRCVEGKPAGSKAKVWLQDLAKL